MKTTYIILTWFGLMLAASLAGFFDTPNDPPLHLLLAVATPLVLYAIDRPILGGALFGGLHRLESHTLILWQVDRVIGFAFLVAYAQGHLPSGFALPAGIGDVLIGLAAPWVAYNLQQQRPHAITVARWWNYLGLLDLVVAVSMGITHSGSVLGIFAQDISMRPIGQYPLSLIPTWAVPLAIILHLRSLKLLRQEHKSTPTFPTTQPA